MRVWQAHDVTTDLALTLALASLAAFALAYLSAVTGFGGGVLLLPVFTALFGLRAAIPTLTITQLASNAGRVWFNRSQLQWHLIRRFSAGAVPFALAGALVFVTAPLAPLQRLLGAFLLVVVAYRRLHPHPHKPSDRAFVGVGAASGFGSALLGSVGPLTAPFFLAYGLSRGAYIGTEAACALVLHMTKLVAYGAGALLTPSVLLYGLVLTPATVAGSWLGKRTVSRLSEERFVLLVEIGLVVAGLFLLFSP